MAIRYPLEIVNIRLNLQPFVMRCSYCYHYVQIEPEHKNRLFFFKLKYVVINKSVFHSMILFAIASDRRITIPQSLRKSRRSRQRAIRRLVPKVSIPVVPSPPLDGG